jgi:hypothetical protein
MYRLLQTQLAVSMGVDMEAYVSRLPEATLAKGHAALTLAELACDVFADEEAAVMALLRAQALLDTARPTERLNGFANTPNGLWCAKAYALGARAALWLARDAQRRSPSPPGSKEMLQLRLSHQTSLAKTIQACLATAFESPAVRPLALAMLARFWIEQVASDQGASF